MHTLILTCTAVFVGGQFQDGAGIKNRWVGVASVARLSYQASPAWLECQRLRCLRRVSHR